MDVSKLVCTLCADVITARTYNIERHFLSKHKDGSEMANEEKSGYISKSVSNFGKQTKVLLPATITLHLPLLLQLFALALKEKCLQMANF